MKNVLLKGTYITLKHDLAVGERYQGVLCTQNVYDSIDKVLVIISKIDDDTFCVSQALQYFNISPYYVSYSMIDKVVDDAMFKSVFVGNLLKTNNDYYIVLENTDVLSSAGETITTLSIIDDIEVIYRKGIGPFCRYINTKDENEFNEMEILWQKNT